LKLKYLLHHCTRVSLHINSMHMCAIYTSNMHWTIELPAMTTVVPTPFKLRRHHKSHQIAKMPKQSQKQYDI